MAKRIEIVSLGIGNIGSIKNMLRSINVESTFVRCPEESKSPDVLILPGVGAYDRGMQLLNETGWFDWLVRADVKNGPLVVGICLGMQLLCEGSEEGRMKGLGLIPGYFRKFQSVEGEQTHKVPHMGWNIVQFSETEGGFTSSLPSNSRYYFVHSYYYHHVNDNFVLGKSRHGVQFGSAIRNERIVGFQFHPEKSHRFGKELLKAVVNYA